jgi:hypothetical protein
MIGAIVLLARHVAERVQVCSCVAHSFYMCAGVQLARST